MCPARSSSRASQRAHSAESGLSGSFGSVMRRSSATKMFELRRLQPPRALVEAREVQDDEAVVVVLVDLRALPPPRQHVLEVQRVEARSARPATAVSSGGRGLDVQPGEAVRLQPLDVRPGALRRRRRDRAGPRRPARRILGGSPSSPLPVGPRRSRTGVRRRSRHLPAPVSRTRGLAACGPYSMRFVAVRVPRRLGAVAHPELAVDVRQVELDRLLGHEQLASAMSRFERPSATSRRMESSRSVRTVAAAGRVAHGP